MLGPESRADFLDSRARRDAQASENSPQIALFKKAMEYELAFVMADGVGRGSPSITTRHLRLTR